MNHFLAGLGVRERFLLIAGSVTLVLIMLYAFAWRPLSERVIQLRSNVIEQTALQQWMDAAAGEIRQLRASQGANRTERQSLLSLADRTARQGGLGPAIRRVEPEGADKVRIQLEQAEFDEMIGWLEILVSRFHVHIENITVDSRDQPGMVNARVILQASGS